MKQKHKPQSLSFPSSAQIEEAAGDLGLTKDQMAVLEFVIKDAVADLHAYQSWRIGKVHRDNRLSDPIEELCGRLTKLASYLDANQGTLKEILPAPAGTKLGELFSFTGIGRALDRDVFPDDWESLSSHLERSAQPFDAAAVETFYARTREDYGLLHGDQLLLYVLRVVLEPFEAWFAAKAADKGGRPANVERRYIIQRLAKAAPRILGCAPPISVGSPFVALCERVLPLCGFAEDGIDKAVVSALSGLKSKARLSPASGRSTK